MQETTCKDCQNYLQHYAFSRGKLFRVFCGHCTIHTRKKKWQGSKICEEFTSRTPDTEDFVTKEYLTKALLERVLKMELLPEIEDLPTGSPKGCKG